MSHVLSRELLQEYEAYQQHSVYIQLIPTVVQLCGEDRARFLHNMCTNDILKLNAGQGCEVFFTDVKGKIIAHTGVLILEDRILMLTVPGQGNEIMEHLQHYLIREDVEIEDVSTDYNAVLISCGNLDALEGNLETLGLRTIDRILDHEKVQLDFEDAILIRSGFLRPNSYMVLSKQPKLLTSFPELVFHTQALDLLNIVRVECSFPLFGIDYDHSNFPPEIDANNCSISYNKGCYLGQETIARIDALGHVNKQLCSIRFSGSAVPPIGYTLRSAGKAIGKVTSVCWSPREQAPLAMAMLNRGFNEVGTELDSEFGKAEVIHQV